MNRGGQRKLVFSEVQLAEMERLYRAGYSTHDIGKQFGCLMGSVWRRLRDRGVQMRAAGERGVTTKARPRLAAHGYVLVGHEYEHRRVAEAMLGRQLHAGEHVHHKNHDKTDNRPENLEVLSESEHHLLHSVAKWTPTMDTELLALLAEGYSSESAALQLGVTMSAVNNRVRRLQRYGALVKRRPGRKLGRRGEVTTP